MGRPAGSQNMPWAAIVRRLRLHPGRWVMLSEMAAVPERTIMVIRRRERRDLRLDDGVIRCRVKARAWTNDERPIVSLLLKFDPKEK